MNKSYLFSLMVMGSFIVAGCADDATEPTTWEIGDPTTADYPEDY